MLIRRLLAEFKNDQTVPDSERSSVLHTIFCNLMPDANKQESAQSETPAHTAARFIESHLSEPLSLQRLASLVNLSPSHLIRLFQQEFHHSPHEYIILARMNHAKYLLKTTSKPVKAIALEVGYRTESSFTNAFTERSASRRDASAKSRSADTSKLLLGGFTYGFCSNACTTATLSRR